MDGKDMHTRTRRRSGLGFAAVIAAALIIIIAAAAFLLLRKKPAEPDPHEGQVYLDDGFGMTWITPWEGVETNDLSRDDFALSGGRPVYTGNGYETRYGVDVSEHQWGVEWDKVAGADIDFAMIRLGYRGYTEGGIFEDPHFENNIRGALKSGLDVGVYFFSQATTVQEAIEEAQFVLDKISGYSVKMPVVFDWEKIDTEGFARTDGMDSTVLTDCAVAFCQTVRNAGYDACVYFNRHFGYYEFNLSRLTNYDFWIALPGDYPDFYYKCRMWQFSFDSDVPGIDGPADMNMLFIPVGNA